MAVPLLYALRCNLGLRGPRFRWLRLMAAALLVSRIVNHIIVRRKEY